MRKQLWELYPGDFIQCFDTEPSEYLAKSTADVSILVKGNFYEIARIEIHGWYTKIWIKDVPGWFNSVAFSTSESNVGRSEFIVREGI